MKAIHSISCITILLIGVVHLIFAVFSFDKLSLNAVWFVGSGLAIIFTGLTNIIFRENSTSRASFLINQLSNILLLLFIGFVNAVSLMVPGVVGFVAILLLIFTTWKIYQASNPKLHTNIP